MDDLKRPAFKLIAHTESHQKPRGKGVGDLLFDTFDTGAAATSGWISSTGAVLTGADISALPNNA